MAGVSAHGGAETTANPRPGSPGYLKWYWTKSPEGLAKWRSSPHPWTALYNHLAKHMNPAMAKRVASQWFHDTMGYWPGSRGGKNPVGPG
jgi:hypothetical protein